MTRNMLPLALLTLALPLAASAQAPGFIPVQGVLTDTDGVPLEGETDLTLALYAGEAVGEAALYEETVTVTVEDGHFNVQLGAQDDLDLALFRDNGAIFLGLSVNADDEMIPRLAFGTVPYAGFSEFAGEAATLEGFSAADFRATAAPINWAELAGVPATLGALVCADGQFIMRDGDAWGCAVLADEDTLSGLGCDAGQLISWDGAAWGCYDDVNTQLTEAQVEGFITDAPIDLAVGAAVAGVAIATGPHTSTLGWAAVSGRPAGLDDGDDDTHLTEAQVRGFVTGSAIDLAAGASVAGVPITAGPHTSTLPWGTITARPAGLDDGDDDTHLTEAQVEGYITNAPIALAAGATVGGHAVATGPHTISLSWGAITQRPAGLDDGDTDTHLSEGQVEGYITNGAINLAAGAAVSGQPISTGSHTSTLPWNTITARPAGLDDGDDNTQLSEAQVEDFITNGTVNMRAHAVTNLPAPTATSDATRKAYVDDELEALRAQMEALIAAQRHQGAVYRWAVFDTYLNNVGWLMGNNPSLFGGITPSNWTDANGIAAGMSADKEILRTLFNKKGYAGLNATVWSETYSQYTSTTGKVVTALFRVRNTTNAALTWRPSFYYSCQGTWGERASVTVNGADSWNTGGADCGVGDRTTLALSIPANRTSTVIFVSTSSGGMTPGSSIYIRYAGLSFYNNTLRLPAGLEYVDDLDTAAGGWEQ